MNLIIAIDGYSSSGKSTLAKDLARELNYKYIDTGAMYRAVTLFALKNNIIDTEQDEINEARLMKMLDVIQISFQRNSGNGEQEVLLNGQQVEGAIRGMEVSSWVSQISALGFVRKKMVELQQDMGRQGGIVMDGRDIGTVVFPNAQVKIFMNADAEARAQRRYEELQAQGREVSYQEVEQNIRERDFMDENRSESPLRRAEDAVDLDNSQMTREEQFKWALALVRKTLRT
ncbi:MAG: (d)CMP kinase [Bacteroidales bacterium]|jgi:cytidylate kinase